MAARFTVTGRVKRWIGAKRSALTRRAPRDDLEMSQRPTFTLEGPHPFRGYDLRDGDHSQHVVLNLTQLERYDEAALLWRETVRLGEVLFRLALARWSPVSVYNLPSSHRPSFHRLLFHRLKVRSLSRCAECRHSHRGSSAQKLTRVR